MTRTLHVTIGPNHGDNDRTDLADTLATIDVDGPEAVEPTDPVLVVEDLETFGRIFRSTNLAILETIARHEPGSIRELARQLDRHPPDVLENVNELVDYGLVELVEDGAAKRPVLFYDEIDADLPLGGSTDEVDADAVRV